MRPFHLITTAIVLLGFLAIGALTPAAAYEEAPQPSGFLDDYSMLKADPAARATGVGRGSAAMEGECRDGGSGEIVWQVIKASKGKRTSGVTTWSGAESAVRQWARDLAERIAAKRQADS